MMGKVAFQNRASLERVQAHLQSRGWEVATQPRLLSKLPMGASFMHGGSGKELKSGRRIQGQDSNWGKKKSLVPTLELRPCWGTSEGDKLLWGHVGGRPGLGEHTWEQGS